MTLKENLINEIEKISATNKITSIRVYEGCIYKMGNGKLDVRYDIEEYWVSDVTEIVEIFENLSDDLINDYHIKDALKSGYTTLDEIKKDFAEHEIGIYGIKYIYDSQIFKNYL